MMARRRRRVRLHLAMAGVQSVPSLEGVLLGRRDGCYELAVPKVMESPERTHELASDRVMIPYERVVFYEVIGS